MASNALSMTIWKFDLPIDDHVIIQMPWGAKIIHVGAQDGTVKLWAIVDPKAQMVDRHIFVRGTGYPMGDHVPWRHIGTVMMKDGALVWHIFEPRGV